MAAVSEDYLAHYGVLGMKWGVRKERYSPDGSRKLNRSETKEVNRLAKEQIKTNRAERKAEVKTAKQNVRIQKGNEQLDRSGGSLAKANTKTAGKVIASNVIGNVGAALIGELTGNRNAAKGAAIVANLIQAGVLVKGINDINNANQAARDRAEREQES